MVGFNEGFVPIGAGADTEVTGAETQVDTAGSPDRLKSYGATVLVGNVVDITTAAAPATQSSE